MIIPTFLFFSAVLNIVSSTVVKQRAALSIVTEAKAINSAVGYLICLIAQDGFNAVAAINKSVIPFTACVDPNAITTTMTSQTSSITSTPSYTLVLNVTTSTTTNSVITGITVANNLVTATFNSSFSATTTTSAPKPTMNSTTPTFNSSLSSTSTSMLINSTMVITNMTTNSSTSITSTSTSTASNFNSTSSTSISPSSSSSSTSSTTSNSIPTAITGKIFVVRFTDDPNVPYPVGNLTAPSSPETNYPEVLPSSDALAVKDSAVDIVFSLRLDLVNAGGAFNIQILSGGYPNTNTTFLGTSCGTAILGNPCTTLAPNSANFSFMTTQTIGTGIGNYSPSQTQIWSLTGNVLSAVYTNSDNTTLPVSFWYNANDRSCGFKGPGTGSPLPENVAGSYDVKLIFIRTA